MDHLLNAWYFVFHTALMTFNAVGWVSRRTRPWHLTTMGLTAGSWFLLAPLLGYQVGYCLCTDWHLQVRDRLGYERVHESYVSLLAAKTLGVELERNFANGLAMGVFLEAALAAVVLNLADRRRKRGAGGRPAARTSGELVTSGTASRSSDPVPRSPSP